MPPVIAEISERRAQAPADHRRVEAHGGQGALGQGAVAQPHAVETGAVGVLDAVAGGDPEVVRLALGAVGWLWLSHLSEYGPSAGWDE